MNEGVDTGDIISEEKTTIGSDETFPELSERLAKIAEKLLLSTLPSWINKEIEAVPQDNSKATLCQLIEREDGKIIWSDDAEDLYNRYRAFFSWPGVYAFWEKDEKPVRLKLRKINLLKNSPQTLRHIGEVFEIGDEIGVMTGKGVIILEEVQLEGKNSVGIREFMNGYSSFLGSVLK
jgi:methionyl-tRNA formyltransferase